MLPLERFRALLPDGCELTDNELRKLVDQMYTVAGIAVEQALAQRATRARLSERTGGAVEGPGPAPARPMPAKPLQSYQDVTVVDSATSAPRSRLPVVAPASSRASDLMT